MSLSTDLILCITVLRLHHFLFLTIGNLKGNVGHLQIRFERKHCSKGPFTLRVNTNAECAHTYTFPMFTTGHVMLMATLILAKIETCLCANAQTQCEHPGLSLWEFTVTCSCSLCPPHHLVEQRRLTSWGLQKLQNHFLFQHCTKAYTAGNQPHLQGDVAK